MDDCVLSVMNDLHTSPVNEFSIHYGLDLAALGSFSAAFVLSSAFCFT